VGIWQRLIGAFKKKDFGDGDGSGGRGPGFFSAHSVTGVDVNQATALTATTPGTSPRRLPRMPSDPCEMRVQFWPL